MNKTKFPILKSARLYFVFTLSLLSFATTEPQLSIRGKQLESSYKTSMIQLQKELLRPVNKLNTNSQREAFLKQETYDAKLAKFVVLNEAGPKALAEFAHESKLHEQLIRDLLADPKLMIQMLIADGAKRLHIGRNLGPAQYGPAIKIYKAIQDAHPGSKSGLFQRLALAISLEHSVHIKQSKPLARPDAAEFVDPINRYQHYQEAYMKGELDSTFPKLSVWELRMVVNGDEPDETLAWGRKMMRNYRPDHITSSNEAWRYVRMVSTDIKYGSGDVKYDLPELQKYQNILMNGGVCGRRAFFGRFILRAFGVPTIARPSRGHGALARFTSDGWVVCLGGGWGAGWTKTLYVKDKDFLASTQARKDSQAFKQVKRAQWLGDVNGEKRIYGVNDKDKPDTWNQLALDVQALIIESLNAKTLKAVGANLGEADGKAYDEKMVAKLSALAKKILYNKDGSITIPASAYSESGSKGITTMKSFDQGFQLFLPRFDLKGTTLLRGGSWKGDSNACSSGWRLPSSGYGQYENWGFRAALTHDGGAAPKEISIKINDEVSLEFVYIKPGSFIMGGESKTDGNWHCVELPKHKVNIRKGFYMGKYEITQAQFDAIMTYNPSRSTKGANHPVDNISRKEALTFCENISLITKRHIRLPTEAEWEYSARAGSKHKWFFGPDSSLLENYAWAKNNGSKKSHEVGQKKPNLWGLYDVYGNVLERVADTYHKNYYAQSPVDDPKGPQQEIHTKFEYEVTLNKAGEYLLSALVLTNKHSQQLSLEVNQTKHEINLPFTLGEWQHSSSITVKFNRGKNILKFQRNKPPQSGMALKSISLKAL